jgi:Cdc6-like AAA superfamily ATPase
MSYPEQYGIIANFDILSEGYIPENIPGREAQITELKACLDPVAKRKKPMNVWLYGPPGTGKTSTSRYMLTQLKDAYRVYGVYVNCWKGDSLYAVLVRCNRVTSSDVMNLSDVFRCLAMSGHFLVQRIHLSDFYVKHKFSSFRGLKEGLGKRSKNQGEARWRVRAERA